MRICGKSLLVLFLFSFASHSFSQSWLEKIKNSGVKIPDSVKEKVTETFSDETVKKSLNKTAESMENAFEDITPEEEYYIGRAVAAKILSKYKVYDSDEAQSYLNKVLHSLTVFSERPILFRDYSVVILDSDELNAFATSGGHIMVTLGLVKCCESEDALAAVLAHEVGHVLLEHSAKAIKKSRIGGAFAQAGGTAVVAANSGSAESVAQAAAMTEEIDSAISELLEKGYSKQQELSADTKALELLYGAGYNPRAMDSVLKALKEKSSASDASGFGKTHPTPDVRLKNVAIRYKFYPSESSYKNSEERVRRFKNFISLFG